MAGGDDLEIVKMANFTLIIRSMTLKKILNRE